MYVCMYVYIYIYIYIYNSPHPVSRRLARLEGPPARLRPIPLLTLWIYISTSQGPYISTSQGRIPFGDHPLKLERYRED